MKLLSLFALTLILGTVVLLPGRALAQPAQPQVEFEGPAVIEAWVDALDAHDVDAALGLLADESFLILNSSEGDSLTTYAGKAEIGELLEVYALDNVRVRLQRAPQVENETNFWTESRTSDRLSKLGISTAEYIGEALVSEGKIVSLIYTPTPETEAAIARATGAEPMGMPMSGVTPPGEANWVVWLALGLWSVMAGACLIVFTRREVRQST